MKVSFGMFNPANELERSQDLEAAYHDAGQFIGALEMHFLTRRNLFFSDHSKVVIMPRDRVQDIDTVDD